MAKKKKIESEIENSLLAKLGENDLIEYKKLSTQLKPQQRLFCLYYAKDANGAEAARNAGYSDRTARTQASRLLTNDNIKKYLNFIYQILERDEIADISEVRKKLTRILRRDEKETVVVTLKNRTSSYDEKGKKVIKEWEDYQLVEIPAKLCDVIRAADTLARCSGFYNLKADVNVTGDMKVSPDENALLTLAQGLTLDDMEGLAKEAAAWGEQHEEDAEG